jgi:hypothetical protein
LTGGDLLDGLPQRCETLRHLLHLRRVEGGGVGAFDATVSEAVFSGPAGGFVQPSCWIQLAIICLASGDQPSSGALVAIICFVASP